MDKQGTYIIAEAGVNHNGSFALAKEMVDAAAEAGADCVKFQTFTPEKLVSEYAEKAEYQKKNTGSRESQLDMLKKLTLAEDEYRELSDYALKRGIDFCSTAFDEDSIRFVHELHCKFWKIPSGEITNMPYLIQIARYNEPIIMSTGMSTPEEIQMAVEIIKEYSAAPLVLLHCNTEYPTPYEDVNLLAMKQMEQEFHCRTGYSDHTTGIEIPVAAAALGAKVIEKHFTLDRTMEGPDHRASLEPLELCRMVRSIRNVELALGSGVKTVQKSEQKNIRIARKSITAKTKIHKGELLTEENITTKRPGDGISPMRWREVLGTRAVRNFAEDEMIEI